MKVAITAAEAKKLTLKLGYEFTADGTKTYYAADYEAGEIWEYDSKAKRDAAVAKSKSNTAERERK